MEVDEESVEEEEEVIEGEKEWPSINAIPGLEASYPNHGLENFNLILNQSLQRMNLYLRHWESCVFRMSKFLFF